MGIADILVGTADFLVGTADFSVGTVGVVCWHTVDSIEVGVAVVYIVGSFDSVVLPNVENLCCTGLYMAAAYNFHYSIAFAVVDIFVVHNNAVVVDIEGQSFA